MNMFNIIVIIGLLFCAIWYATQSGTRSAPFAPQSITGRVRYVVDGDSLYIASHRPQVRLWGVNTPERGERGYQEATDHLKRIAQGKRIKCEVMDTDKYGRTVGRCILPDGRDIAREMLKSGYAKEMRGFSRGYYSRS